jgi:hypothetical protein
MKVLICAIPWTTTETHSRSRSHITTDSHSASQSWCQAPIWDPRPIIFLLEIFFRQLRVCYFVAPSLTRGRVCNLLLLLVSPAQSRSVYPLRREARSVFCHPLLVSVHSQSVCTKDIYIIYVWHSSVMYNIYKATFSPGSVQQIMSWLLMF